MSETPMTPTFRPTICRQIQAGVATIKLPILDDLGVPHLDGWMDRWDGWMDGWIHGWIAVWMDGWMDGWKDGWIAGWMDG